MSDEAENLEVEENLETGDNETKAFDDAFDEIAAAKDGDNEEEDLDDLPGDEPGDEDPDNLESPAAEASEEAAKTDEKPENTPEGFDDWSESAQKNYTELQERHDKLDHRVKSDNGRVGAFQRKINNLEHEIAEIRTKPGDQPSNDEITEAMATDEGWSQFSEDYPEIAEAIDKRMDNRLGSQEEKINTALAPVIEKQQENAQTEAYGEISETFPKWQEAVQKPEYDEWINQQPEAVRSLGSSSDVADATSLMGLYDNHLVANGLPSMKTDHVPDGDTVVENEVPNELEEKRKQQLEAGTTVPSKKARIDPSSEAGSDFDNAFEVFAAKKIRQNRQA